MTDPIKTLLKVEAFLRQEMERGYVLTGEPGAGALWRARYNELLGEVEASLTTKPNVRAGVALVLRRGDFILMGKRKGAHGAGTWAFPGGKLEWNETVTRCASREGGEETGYEIPESSFSKLTFTNDVFTTEDKHFITVYVEAVAPPGEPWVMEPEKCEKWGWFSAPPSPLFLPVKNLLADGFDPWKIRCK